ncbi:uncharacterized protein LOC125861676 [Solanum stenotomum]|uniref:uncharacterized protein LOC125861676 n=1 Tax=Solanum stenotomum TaxID=172797 RepID=UPI0020CFEBB2|nr:uncharacterized protein LOC125861676 [Solanum stenotomum]
MAKRVCVDGEDRISELPVHIIHHILCRTDLDVEEAAISCMLSKRWPLENYVKLADQSLRSHVEKNLHLEQFILTYNGQEVDPHVDTWIELAVKLNVTELGIHRFGLTSYNLPDVIYDAKKLTTLQLSRCNFEFDKGFSCLESLSLNHVHISDAQLQRVIDRCPSIRTLRLQCCQGISKCHIFGLVHLKYFDASYCKLHSVIVQAPYLQCFRYTEPTEQGNPHPCEIAILDGYNTLQTLKLTGATITDQQFRDVSYKFPNISELDLARCFKLKNIEIQSEKLKKFTLLEELNSLEKITIQAPNLLKFDFHGSKMPFTYMDTSSLESARLNFFFPGTNFGSVDRSWYTSLHHFVQKFNYSKDFILIIFCHQTRSILIYENLREIVIPPSHKVEIFIASMLRVEWIIEIIMFDCPYIISILPCTDSKALQAMSTLKGCIQKQNCGKECPSDTIWHRNLKEVISCTGTSEEGMAASMWYLWLKSTSLFDQVNNFMLKWKDEA